MSPSAATPKRSGARPAGPEVRERLIDAAERLLGERQVSAITTRDIARSAGLSDGVLYNYFADKHDLLVAALLRRYGATLDEFERDLPAPGTASVESNLRAYADALFALVDATLPVIAGLVSEPDLLHRFVAEIHGEEYGMGRTIGRVATYLEAERAAGRLGDLDVDAAVTALTGSVMALGFRRMILGWTDADIRQHTRRIVRTLLDGIGP